MNSQPDLRSRMQRFLRADVQGMHAYAVQDSRGMVKLDAMENPFSLPPALKTELGARLAEAAINRYPAQRAEDLRQALKTYVSLPPGCELMLGNGSDELISLLTLAADLPGNCVLAPVPGFVMYEMSAKLQGLNFVGVPLTTDFELDRSAMLAAIEQHQPALIWLAYPNNPTANLWNEDDIAAIVAAAPGLVVMDEAYQPFASRDSMAMLTQHEHVLVMRTLSKFGLAGVRIGYLCGQSSLIAEIDKLRPPYNISVLNAEAGLFALEHADEYGRQAAAIRTEREGVFAELRKLPGVQPYPSQANMILVRVPDAARCFAGMKQRGVLIKNVAGLHPLLANCLRLTIGTPEENQAMMKAFKESL